MNEFMKAALAEAEKGSKAGDGGPFGAVIVRDNKIIASGHNSVLACHDPTAHAEMVAIREASQKLKNWHLKGCEIYTTCEPCPMCFAAILWARLERVYYGCTRDDAAAIGFDDNLFYQVLSGKKKSVDLVALDREDCLGLFKSWGANKDKILY